MVTTRSNRSSTKHEAPKVEKGAPAKKQKTSKATKKDIENGESEDQPQARNDPNVEKAQKAEPQERNGNQTNGKAPAEEPAAAEAEKKTTGGAARDSNEAR